MGISPGGYKSDGQKSDGHKSDGQSPTGNSPRTELTYISCLMDIIKKSTTGKMFEDDISLATGERKSNFGSLTF